MTPAVSACGRAVHVDKRTLQGFGDAVVVLGGSAMLDRPRAAVRLS